MASHPRMAGCIDKAHCDCPSRLSHSAFARHRGIDQSTVSRMVQSGRLEAGPDRLLDRAESDARYEGRTRHKLDGAASAGMARSAPGATGAEDDGGDIPEAIANSRALWDARKARASALREERKNATEAGTLISEVDVTARYTETLLLVKRRMMGLPARVAGRLAGLDAHALERELGLAIREELAGAGDDLRALAGEVAGAAEAAPGG